MEILQGLNYIFVEGIDGVGKSSLIDEIAREYEGKVDRIIKVAEPKGDAWEAWRLAYEDTLGLEGRGQYYARVQLMAFGLGVRVGLHIRNLVTLDLSQRNLIISDRSFVSGLVYQHTSLEDLISYSGIYDRLYRSDISRYSVRWVNTELGEVFSRLEVRDSIKVDDVIRRNMLGLRRLYLVTMLHLQDIGIEVDMDRSIDEVKRELGIVS